ncbi:hypothetical protein CLF_103918 [Clonorchis sinensis]|uniref:Uncharacterized protein n=1 Tax=Clonorchis sinensis TaxID=79923 RepID=G7YAM4_CLOSI|nr:hypothetical protein CLF_103918 [Clonorchis sinensis]
MPNTSTNAVESVCVFAGDPKSVRPIAGVDVLVLVQNGDLVMAEHYCEYSSLLTVNRRHSDTLVRWTRYPSLFRKTAELVLTDHRSNSQVVTEGPDGSRSSSEQCKRIIILRRTSNDRVIDANSYLVRSQTDNIRTNSYNQCRIENRFRTVGASQEAPVHISCQSIIQRVGDSDANLRRINATKNECLRWTIRPNIFCISGGQLYLTMHNQARFFNSWSVKGNPYDPCDPVRQVLSKISIGFPLYRVLCQVSSSNVVYMDIWTFYPTCFSSMKYEVERMLRSPTFLPDWSSWLITVEEIRHADGNQMHNYQYKRSDKSYVARIERKFSIRPYEQNQEIRHADGNQMHNYQYKRSDKSYVARIERKFSIRPYEKNRTIKRPPNF